MLLAAGCDRQAAAVKDSAASVGKAAAAFAAAADPNHTGHIARADDPAVKAYIDTLTDTRPPAMAPFDALGDLADWGKDVALSEMVYLLAGTGYASLADAEKATDPQKLNADVNRNAVLYAPELGRFYDAQLAVMGVMSDTIFAEMGAQPAADANEKTKRGMLKFKAGTMQAVESLIATIALDGMSDGWRAARIEALEAFAAQADKLLDATERATLHDAATAAAGTLHESEIAQKLRRLARTFAPDAPAALMTPSTGRAPTQAAPASGDPAAECKSYGLAPGTDGYKSCVDAMTEADNAAAGAAPDTGADRIRTNIERQRAALQKDMEAQMRAAQHPADGSPSRCVTTVTGTNTATSCP